MKTTSKGRGSKPKPGGKKSFKKSNPAASNGVMKKFNGKPVRNQNGGGGGGGFKKNFRKSGPSSSGSFGGSRSSGPGYRGGQGDGDEFRYVYEKGWKQLVTPDGSKWWEFEDPVEAAEDQADSKIDVIEKKKEAKSYLAKDIGAYQHYSSHGASKTDFLWMNKVMKSGTLSDKMAAFTVRIQDSPIHNLHCLQSLIKQVKPQGKKHCLTTLDTVKELFVQELLPPNRKLRSFEEHTVALESASEKNLMLWFFEDRLKGLYAGYIDAIEKMANDTVEQVRGKSVSVFRELLQNHPEREARLLNLLVNKLGDPAKKIASGALHQLNKLVLAHPKMKTIVVGEVERLLFRNNVGKKAQYYGLCFLNLVKLQDEHPQLSVKMMKIYVGFFKACIKLGEIDSKLMNVLLIGVNKAFPKAQLMGMEFSESVDTLYKIVALSQFNIGIQALAVLQQMNDASADSSKADRFYRVLYEKLLSPDLGTTALSMKFLNLTHKALVADTMILRVTAMVKRLLQICHHVPPNIACGILYLVSETMKTHRKIFHFSKEQKQDTKPEETAEEQNGDVQLDELPENKRKQLEKFIKKSNVQMQKKQNHPKADAVIDLESSTTTNVTTKPSPTEPIPVDLAKVKTEIRATSYDAMARNPLYCGANLTLTYELTSLCQHFHPSVSLFAKTLTEKRFIKYDGNPLRDFTVARFLERFVYRNAKVNKMRQQYVPRGLRAIAVNSNEYLKADESTVPEEEKFFYKYFKQRQEVKKSKRKVKDDEEISDAESVGDEEFDDIMANYFKQTGALAGSEDEEENLDFAADIRSLDKKKKKGKKGEDDDEESDEDDGDDGDFDQGDDEGSEGEAAMDADDLIDLDDVGGDEDGDDDEIDFDDFDEDGASGSDFELDGEDMDDEDDEMAPIPQPQKQRKKKLKALSDSMFIPAEQFGDMLDANADEDFTSSHTFINKDNADMKQLKWESERDRWTKGYKKTSKVSFKSSKKGGGKKRR